MLTKLSIHIFGCNPREFTYFIPSMVENNTLSIKIRINLKAIKYQISSMNSKVWQRTLGIKKL